DYLKSVKPAEIDGTEAKDISITFPSGQTRQFTGQSLLWATACPISISTPPRPTTFFGSARWRSENAISWARQHEKLLASATYGQLSRPSLSLPRSQHRLDRRAIRNCVLHS